MSRKCKAKKNKARRIEWAEPTWFCRVRGHEGEEDRIPDQCSECGESEVVDVDALLVRWEPKGVA